MTVTLELPDEIATQIENLPEDERNNLILTGLNIALSNALPQATFSVSRSGKTGKKLHEEATPEERVAAFHALLDRLHSRVPQNEVPLSDYAVSREGIYED